MGLAIRGFDGARLEIPDHDVARIENVLTHAAFCGFAVLLREGRNLRLVMLGGGTSVRSRFPVPQVVFKREARHEVDLSTQDRTVAGGEDQILGTSNLSRA